MIAVIKPAAASAPLDTPKAKAKGNATAATVIPAKDLSEILKDHNLKILFSE